MAAATLVETVTISINDIELQVPKGELIVESVKRLGLEIPIFCYHSRLKPVGMCRMCLVEVGFKQPDGSIRKMPKPQAGCTLPASEGMAIYTDSELVHRDRKGVLEFLLVNHPLDCPICDRGGECPLQNNTLFYGPSTSRFVEFKRHLPKAFPLSQYVTLDLERCIQCGRCVRFTEEISGDSQLAFRFRGAEMQPSTFELRDFESKFSGNVIEICPVGALTSTKYRFRARPWDLETKPAICTRCSNGCNVWFDYRVDRAVRINGRTNEAVNEEWTCDKGKFGHDFYNADNRTTRVLARRGSALVETSWADAYSDVIRAFSQGGDSVALLGGNENSNEDLFLAQSLFDQAFGSKNLDFRWTSHLPTPDQSVSKVLGLAEVQDTLEGLGEKARLFVFGTSLADDLPIVFLRVRKAWFTNGAKVVVAHHAPTDVDSFAEVVLRYAPGTEATLAGGLLKLIVDSGAAKVSEATMKLLAKLDPQTVSQSTGVPIERLKEAAAILAEGVATVTSDAILNAPAAQDVVETLAGMAMATGGSFNQYSLRANDQGARELGYGSGKNTREILEGCVDGSVKALWLLGCDPIANFADRDLVERALESVPFLVVQSHSDNGATAFASVVLPMAAPAETDGTYTNCTRRVQRMGRIFAPKGDAKPAWRVFSEISMRLQPRKPDFNVDEVGARLSADRSAFEACNFESVPPEGRQLP